MPLGSVAACSLPNHRDRVLHFTAHTLCNTYVYVYITHTRVWVLPHRRRILFEGRQCSAAMVRRRLLCHGEGWVLTIYLCLLYFRISIFLYFVFFALELGAFCQLIAVWRLRGNVPHWLYFRICILYLFCISYILTSPFYFYVLHYSGLSRQLCHGAGCFLTGCIYFVFYIFESVSFCIFYVLPGQNGAMGLGGSSEAGCKTDRPAVRWDYSLTDWLTGQI